MCPQPGGIPSELTTAFPDANLPLGAGEVDAVDSRVRLPRHRLSPFSWRYQHTNGPPQRRATTSGVSAEHCTPSSSPTKLKGEGLNKSHDDQRGVCGTLHTQ